MNRWLLAVLAFLSFHARLEAHDTLRPGTPEQVEMEPAVLQAGVTLFRQAVERDELQGAVLLVARHGRIVLHEAIGWRDKQAERPIERDTLFRMASNTKPVVAAAILALAEEGKLRLDDPVSRHLPAFARERSEEIRIEHLLMHTSGLRIPTIFLKPLLERSSEHPDAPSLRLEVNRFAEIGPKGAPGTSYSYSNPGYNTLGAIIETVSGQPLETFLHQQFYGPLGMNDTHHVARPDKQSRMASVYKRKQGKWQRTWQPGDAADYPFVRGSGGMISTAADYARFCQMFLCQGRFEGRQYLTPDSIKAATSPQTRSLYTEKELASRTSFYGYGWSVSGNGVYCHGGSDGTFAWVDPHRHIVGIVLTQSVGGRNPRDQFVRIVAASCRDEAKRRAAQ
jgi:CubicO group peptidase (beta-lactamase class C family)